MDNEHEPIPGFHPRADAFATILRALSQFASPFIVAAVVCYIAFLLWG